MYCAGHDALPRSAQSRATPLSSDMADTAEGLPRRSAGEPQTTDFVEFRAPGRDWHELCEETIGAKAAHRRSELMKAYFKVDHVDKSFARGASVTSVLKDVSLAVAT